MASPLHPFPVSRLEAICRGGVEFTVHEKEVVMRRFLFVVIGLSVFASETFAQDTVFLPTYPKHVNLEHNTRIVVPPLLHPEVAVSRTLAAQPVHPHMVQVVIGGSNRSAALTTWIDPLRRIDGEGRLDANHSLVRAQRLYNALRGVTTEQINALRHASLALEPRGVGANRALLIITPSHTNRAVRAAVERPNLPVMILPSPLAPRDGRPNVQPDRRRFDIRVAPEHPRPAKDGALLAGSRPAK